MKDKLKILLIFIVLSILYACYKAPPSEPYKVVELNNLILQANKNFERGHIQSAEILYHKALKKARLIQDDNVTAVILVSLSRLYTSMDKIEEAKKYITTAKELSKKAQLEECLVEEIVFEKAKIDFLTGQDSEGLLKNLINSKTVSIKIKSLNLLARVKTTKGEDNEAEELLKEALKINQNINKVEEANSWRILGEIYSKKDKSLAEKYFFNALLIDKRLAIPEKIALDMEVIGKFYKSFGDKDKAKDYFIKAAEIWRELERRKQEEKILRELESL